MVKKVGCRSAFVVRVNKLSLNANKNLPIGIFDSGIGGLTVLSALRDVMPQEPMLYLGDTARLPYGTKSSETVCHYALNACEVLVEQGIKCLVVACNTATAVALEAISARFPEIPVVGVIQPGAAASLTVSSTGPIVVLATESTAKGHAYQKILKTLAPEREVIEWPCQLWVALAEEGWREGALVEAILAEIIKPLNAQLNGKRPACYLLGCTHFPVLKQALQSVLGESMVIVDPARTVAQRVLRTLEERDLLICSDQPIQTRFLATDGIERFARVAQIFLGEKVAPDRVELVSVPFTPFDRPLSSQVPLSPLSSLSSGNADTEA
jgi:glutamate racemase